MLQSGASVYTEAMQLLDHCRRARGVLGGLILYNNKYVLCFGVCDLDRQVR